MEQRTVDMNAPPGDVLQRHLAAYEVGPVVSILLGVEIGDEGQTLGRRTGMSAGHIGGQAHATILAHFTQHRNKIALSQPISMMSLSRAGRSGR